MKKKIMVFCFFVLMALMVLPVVSSYRVVSEQKSSTTSAVEKQISDVQKSHYLRC